MTEVQSKWQEQSRGDYAVIIYNEDANIHHDIHGAINTGAGYRVAEWKADGTHRSHTQFDLLPIKKKKRVYKTLNEIALDYSFSWNPFDTVVYGKDNTHYKAASCLIGSDRDVAMYASETWLEIFTKWEEEV